MSELQKPPVPVYGFPDVPDDFSRVVLLMDKYKETRAITAVKARNELATVSMGKRKHLDYLFDKLLMIKVKFGRIVNSGISDEVLIAQVIAATPDSYSAVITNKTI